MFQKCAKKLVKIDKKDKKKQQVASYLSIRGVILSSTPKKEIIYTEVCKMKKKVLSFLLAATMVMGLATGCGSGTSTSEGSDSSDGAATEAAAADDAADSSDDAASSSADGDVQVGIVLPTKDEPRWLQDQKQFETILGDAGFTNQVLFSQGS